MASTGTNPHDTAPNEAPTLAGGGNAVASSGYKVPADSERPKNLVGKNQALAEDDADLEPAREIFSEAKAKGDTKFKSTVADEHDQAQHGGAADKGLHSEAAKLKEDLISKHPEIGTNRAAN